MLPIRGGQSALLHHASTAEDKGPGLEFRIDRAFGEGFGIGSTA